MQEHVKSKVLVVDDNAENRALAHATLSDEGHDVVLAATGADGVRAFEVERPDCVLLDVRMPGTDGFSVCTQIRSLPGGAEIPILFLTALRDVDTFDRALRAGCDDFLTKPFRPAELVVRVETALKLRRMSAELQEHYTLVRRQRDDLMRLQLQKERLTTFVIHDLKSPLNAMDMHAQVLLGDPELRERNRASVQGIRKGVRSLLRLILNLLDISKSEEGQLVPRLGDVDLEDLVSEVLDAHDRTIRARVTLSRTINVRGLRADADLLRRVLENLVDNAIRYAPEGSEVRVTTVRRTAGIEIRVADSGPGIALDLRDKVFERFVQVDAGELSVRATNGLGLTFCKLAIEAHGGTIWVEDGMPGSTFCACLPH